MMRLVIAAALSVTLALAGCAGDAGGDAVEPIELDILVKGVEPSIGDSIEVEDVVRVMGSGTVLGTVTHVSAEKSRVTVVDEQGVLREARSPLLVDVIVTVSGEAAVSDEGYRFGREYVRINSGATYLTQLVQFEGVVTRLVSSGDRP